ncbi:hypothetical protein PGT21_005881 [Puccinia graminis f. sp. tritici]|uniref:Uncharacterized protein n=1 Tax=Puccinia graminis f. sp. tritici TaxID=56615 RepID=A0A5B0QEI3_PUCGR|nr:hypothetical protein PGT21_005881 [Puccinia graminis f. sp. tritici]
MIFPLLLISLCPMPTTLGAFIDKSVENRVEGSNTVHHLCDTTKETLGNPQLPPTDSLQALTLTGSNQPKDMLDHPLLSGSTSATPPISSGKKSENFKVRENWITNEERLFLLYQDSIEIEKIHKQIVDSGEFSLPMDSVSVEGELDASRAYRNIIEFRKKIEIFKKVKFWELANLSLQSSDSNGKNILNLLLKNQKDFSMPDWLQNLSPQMLASIPKETWREFALFYVNQAQDYLEKLDTGCVRCTICSGPITYLFPLLFKTIDFLYKQDFIDDKVISSLFKDRDILVSIVYPCTHDIFWKHYPPLPQARYQEYFPQGHMMQALIDIQQNWFLPFGFKFYHALSKQELMWMKYDIVDTFMVNAFWKALGEEGRTDLEEWVILSKSLDERHEERMKMLLDVKHDPTSSDVKKQAAFDVDVEQLIKFLKRVYAKDDTLLIDYTQRERLITSICEMLDFIDKNFSQGIIGEQAKNPVINDKDFEEKFQLILSSNRIFNLADLAIEYKNMCKSDEIEFSKSYPFNNNCMNLPYADRMQGIYTEFKKIYAKIEERKDELSNWLKEQKDMKSLLNIEELRYEHKQIFHEMGIK